MKYYRGSQADIEAYHNALHSQPELPVNFPNGYQMTEWAQPKECLDGLWCYPKPDDDVLLTYVDQSRVDEFRAMFADGKLTVEERNPDWFPEIDTGE